MSEEGFLPNRIEILAGDTVVFENSGDSDHWPASNVHPTHELYPDMDAQRPILPGQEWSLVVFRPGLWGIHDHLNPQFTGEVVVLPDSHAIATDDGPAETPAPLGSGLLRVYNAARMFLVRVYDAAKLFVAEAFKSSVVSSPPPIATTEEINTDFRSPPESDIETVYSDLLLECPDDEFDCLAEFFRSEVVSYGPQVAVELVLRLKADGRVGPTVDEHQLAHRIGRQTAESYGVNDQAFLLCPMESLNGGCQHGFFEYVLGRTESTSEAADLICKSLEQGYSTKFQFYCYHGVGHGVMMAAAYDLDRALQICDTFQTFMAQDGCWQGVFMENVNAGMGGYAREGIFREADPLSPCNDLEDKYKHECYVNHAGWLMETFDKDVERGSAACLGAATNHVGACMQSIGLMVTNPVWQPELYGDVEGVAFEEIAWQLCEKFPDGHHDQCVIGAIDNIHNFDGSNLSRAADFCDTVHPEYQNLCYRRMGLNLSNQATNLDDVRQTCSELNDEFESECLIGAGIGVES